MFFFCPFDVVFLHTILLLDNLHASNPNDVANNCFANVGKTTEKGIHQVNYKPSFYLRGNLAEAFFLFPAIPHEIGTLILFSVPVTIVKTIKDYLSQPIPFSINDSLTCGNFPDKVKLAL